MTNIWDANGKLIGSVRELGHGDSNTYDKHGQPLGTVRSTGTYTVNGKKISSTRDAGLTWRHAK